MFTREIATSTPHLRTHVTGNTGFLILDRLEYLKTVVRLASERDDLGPDFTAWLATFVTEEMVR